MPVGCRWVWWRVAAALSAGAGLASCRNALGSVVLCCNVPHLCCNVLYYALCAGVRLGRGPFGAQLARRVSDSARRPQRHAIHRIQTQAQPLRTSEARSSPCPSNLAATTDMHTETTQSAQPPAQRSTAPPANVSLVSSSPFLPHAGFEPTRPDRWCRPVFSSCQPMCAPRSPVHSRACECRAAPDRQAGMDHPAAAGTAVSHAATVMPTVAARKLSGTPVRRVASDAGKPAASSTRRASASTTPAARCSRAQAEPMQASSGVPMRLHAQQAARPVERRCLLRGVLRRAGSRSRQHQLSRSHIVVS
jgi:hypothetical protein